MLNLCRGFKFLSSATSKSLPQSQDCQTRRKNEIFGSFFSVFGIWFVLNEASFMNSYLIDEVRNKTEHVHQINGKVPQPKVEVAREINQKNQTITLIGAIHNHTIGSGLNITVREKSKQITNKHAKNIICYSLYGSNPRYTDGAVANAKLYKEIYPEWTMRVYYDNTVPKNITDQLITADVELVNMTGSKMNKMSWRFQGAADANRSCSRDIDSRLSLREKAAVDDWIKSDKKFHLMRDHPNHSSFAISGGMWCSKTIPNMIKLLAGLRSQAYLVDMNFLNRVIWPMARKSSLQHDAFSCQKWGALPFPKNREGTDFVGNVYMNGKGVSTVNSTYRKKIDEKCLKDNS